MVAAAIGVSAAAGIASGAMQAGAAGDAADAQAQQSEAAIAEQRRQFEEMKKLLKPYVDIGPKALTDQTNLIGMNGNEAQQEAIDQLKKGSMFNELNLQGQNAILQNASATGGLRGGNTQAALAQFSPALLQALIESQYSKLSGLTTLGQNSAAFQGTAGMNMAANIGQSYENIGAAQAGGILGQAKGWGSALNSVSGAINTGIGAGIFGGGSSGLHGDINDLVGNSGLF
jgi:hypothetical protein